MDILQYQNLVYSIANKYSHSRENLEDLYQIGMIALQEAGKRFNQSYNSKFSTYAYIYIKGEILRYLRENRVIKINKDLLKLNTLIEKTRSILQQKYLREISLEEISEFMEVPLEKIIDAIKTTEYVKSLDYELNEDVNLYDSLGYNEKGYNEDIMDLKNELENLNDFEKKLIKLRYYEDKSQQDVANELEMSQVQVSRNEAKILTKLRTKLTA